MKLNLHQIIGGTGVALATAGLLLAAGCAGRTYTPLKANFLSTYIHLKKVDNTTSRWVNTNRLAIYNRFYITSAEVLVNEYDGKPVTEEQKAKASAYLREALSKAFSPAYPVVNEPGPDVGQVRIALTSAYKSGSRVGLTVEGEIQDVSSGVQVAAAMRTELGDVYLGSWWDSTSMKQIVDRWAQRLRETVDIAHGR